MTNKLNFHKNTRVQVNRTIRIVAYCMATVLIHCRERERERERERVCKILGHILMLRKEGHHELRIRFV